MQYKEIKFGKESDIEEKKESTLKNSSSFPNQSHMRFMNS